MRLACFLAAAMLLTGCGNRQIAALPPVAPKVRPVEVQGVHNPLIQSLTANPTNQTAPGQPLTFQAVAFDPDQDVMQFNWSATGGVLSATVGQAVSWMPPASPGVYTVTVTIVDGHGGSTVGSLNLITQADGTARMAAAE